MNKIILLSSGGMDSTTLLYHLHDAGSEVKTLSFDYGQRHKKEIISARKISVQLGLSHEVVDLTTITHLFGSNSLTDSTTEVPEGHYEASNMKQTIVPNRNMIMLSIAIAWAISSEFDGVAYAAHSGDHAIYPDCRPAFAHAMDAASMLCDWREIKLFRPFVDMSKGDIAKRGLELGVPFERTWTCYKGKELHCGKCGSCTERREAFINLGVVDPTTYEPDIN